MLSGPGVVGREAERQRLLAALADPAVRTIVICGPAGAGKTALALEAVAAAGEAEALVGLGKHAEDAAGRSARPLGQALRQLLDAALDRLYDPEAGLAAMRAALGASAPVLGALDPIFAGGRSWSSSAPLTADAAAERLAAAAVAFLRWLSGLGPILLVVDDWGRASPEVCRLYSRLADAPDLPGLTLLATERLEEPSPVAAGLAIVLAPLERAALHAIAAARLDGDAVAAAGLLALMEPGPATPLALLQTIALLAEAGALVRQGQGWTLDRAAAVGVLGGDAAEALLSQLARSAPDLLALLQAAALHGDEAARDHLQAVAGLGERFAAALIRAEAENLLEARAGRVRFRHDTVRAAVLRGLAPAARVRLAGRWAERLRRAGQPGGEDLETMLRLRLEAGLAEADAATWRPLFVAGAARARATDAPDLARTLAEAALALEERTGQASYAAAREAGLAAVQDGDMAGGLELVGLMAARAGSEDERMEAAETEVFAARLSGDHPRAFKVGRAALETVGLTVPERASVPAMLGALLRLKLTPDRRSPGARAHGPAAYRLMNTVGAIAFERDPAIAVTLAARAAAYGPVRGTAFAAGLRTMMACLSGDWAGASRWGWAAWERLDGDEPLRAPAMQTALQFGLGLTIDAARQMAETERLQALALTEGDLGVAAYANRDRALASMRLPITLAAHRATLDACKAAAGRFEDQATEPLIDALVQLSINLAEGGDEPWRLKGAVFDSPRFEQESGPELERVAMACMTFETTLANAFGAWETTLAVWRRMAGRFDSAKHHPVATIWAFHCGLARARLGLPVRRWEQFVVARGARFNPVSYGHRALALKAEAQLRAGRAGAAMVTYEAALVAAAASGFYLEEGVVAVAARSAALQAGRGGLAERFAAAGRAAWLRLGAFGMVEASQPSAGSGGQAGASGQDLAGAAAAADRSNRAKTRLLAGAAHELRTPMQGIQGLLDLAADDPDALDVAQLREAFGGLRAVVDDLTELGSIEAERISIVEAAFSPVRMAQTELKLAGPEAERRGRLLRLDSCLAAALEMWGDAGRIAQILRNLLANALRYGEGETVVRLAAEDGALVLEVADQGPGLTAADQARLFQPFVRGDAAGKAEGSGLGLSLSRRLAQRMGGALTGGNGPDGGAVFRLILPWRAPEAASRAEAAPARPLDILLADDVDLSRSTLARLLQRQGHRVTAVADGEAVLRAASRASFGLLVLDVRMPGVEGPEALAQLRDQGVRAPALMLSASVDERLARRLVGLEPVRLVRKPVTGAQLAALVAEFAEAAGGLAAEVDQVLGEAAAETRAQVALRLAQARTGVAEALVRGDLAQAAGLAHAAAGLAGQFGLATAEAAFAAAQTAAESGDAGAAQAAIEGLETP